MTAYRELIERLKQQALISAKLGGTFVAAGRMEQAQAEINLAQLCADAGLAIVALKAQSKDKEEGEAC